MTASDADFYRRGIDTVLACWEENARSAPGASVIRSPGVAAAVFPSGPERRVVESLAFAGPAVISER